MLPPFSSLMIDDGDLDLLHLVAVDAVAVLTVAEAAVVHINDAVVVDDVVVQF